MDYNSNTFSRCTAQRATCVFSYIHVEMWLKHTEHISAQRQVDYAARLFQRKFLTPSLTFWKLATIDIHRKWHKVQLSTVYFFYEGGNDFTFNSNLSSPQVVERLMLKRQVLGYRSHLRSSIGAAKSCAGFLLTLKTIETIDCLKNVKSCRNNKIQNKRQETALTIWFTQICTFFIQWVLCLRITNSNCIRNL